MKTIEIISIPVTDQEKAKEFYQKLGFEIIAEAPFGPNQKWVQLGLPGEKATIALVTWFDKMQPGCMHGFVIQTDNITREIEELTKKGISIGEIDATPWGKFVSIKDPDGNVISLHE